MIILGDFNLEPEDEGFDELRSLLTPLITGDMRTTISQSSLYDNIWIPATHTTEYRGRWGIDRYDRTAFDNDDDAASLAVSDHRPIWAIFGTATDDD